MSVIHDERHGLERLSQAERMLAEVASAQDAIQIRDMAEAARVWAQRSRLGSASVNHATAIKLKAEMRIADLVDEGQAAGQIAAAGKPVIISSHDNKPASLADIGLTAQSVLEARRIRDAYTPESVDELVAAANSQDQVLSRKDFVKAQAHTKKEGEGDEWYTPRWLFDALGLTFDIDTCSPADRTHVSVPAKRWYTIEDDGLAQPWSGTVWCNPPYSTPNDWAMKMIAHGDGLLLTHIPMNAGWAAEVWRAADGIRLFQAMEFVRPDGAKQRPGYWLMLAAFGPRAAYALAHLEVPDDVAENPRRVPSPMWVRA